MRILFGTWCLVGWVASAQAGGVAVRTTGPVDVVAEDCQVLSITPVSPPSQGVPPCGRPAPVDPALVAAIWPSLDAELDKAPPPALAAFYEEGRRPHGGMVVFGSVLLGLSTGPLIGAAAAEGAVRPYLIPVFGPLATAIQGGPERRMSPGARAALVIAGTAQAAGITLLAVGARPVHPVWRRRPVAEIQLSLSAGPGTVDVHGRF